MTIAPNQEFSSSIFRPNHAAEPSISEQNGFSTPSARPNPAAISSSPSFAGHGDVLLPILDVPRLTPICRPSPGPKIKGLAARAAGHHPRPRGGMRGLVHPQTRHGVRPAVIPGQGTVDDPSAIAVPPSRCGARPAAFPESGMARRRDVTSLIVPDPGKEMGHDSATETNGDEDAEKVESTLQKRRRAGVEADDWNIGVCSIKEAGGPPGRMVATVVHTLKLLQARSSFKKSYPYMIRKPKIGWTLKQKSGNSLIPRMERSAT